MPDDADQLQLFTEAATCEGTPDWTHRPTAMIKDPDGRLYCPRCAVRQTLESPARRGLDAFFLARGATVREATRAEQRRGIDRWIDGRSVEYRADSAASRTGNCFIETVSVDTINQPGWAYTSEADWLFYFLPESELLYIIWMHSLRWDLVGWEKSCRTVTVPNDGYHIHGLLVPQAWIEDLADTVVNGVRHA